MELGYLCPCDADGVMKAATRMDLYQELSGSARLERAMDLVVTELQSLAEKLPKDSRDASDLESPQIRRAAVSIPSYIAEGACGEARGTAT